MGFGAFKFGSFSASRSKCNPVQHPMGARSPSYPWNSRVDHAHDVNPSGSLISCGHSQSYYDDDCDPPPPYYPENGSECSKRPSDIPTPAPYNPHLGTVHKQMNPVDESPLAALEGYDIVIVFDDSDSMLIADGGSGRTRWEQAWSALATLVRVGSQYDRDGIEIHFLNKPKVRKTVKNEAGMQRLRRKIQNMEMGRHTPIGDVLDTLLLEYEKKTGSEPGRSGVKKRIFLVITDGVATDAPEDAITRAANFFQQRHFPLNQVGIQFVQVGNDPKATEYLEKLDEDLARDENTRDIVDTIRSNGDDLQGDALIKALTGGFNRGQDRIGERRRLPFHCGGCWTL